MTPWARSAVDRERDRMSFPLPRVSCRASNMGRLLTSWDSRPARSSRGRSRPRPRLFQLEVNVDRDEETDRPTVLARRAVAPSLDGAHRGDLHARIRRGQDADRIHAARRSDERLQNDGPLEMRLYVDRRVLRLDPREENGLLDPVRRAVFRLGRAGTRRRRGTIGDRSALVAPGHAHGSGGPVARTVALPALVAACVRSLDRVVL